MKMPNSARFSISPKDLATKIPILIIDIHERINFKTVSSNARYFPPKSPKDIIMKVIFTEMRGSIKIRTIKEYKSPKSAK